jgi:hypothetical protein
MLKDMEEHGNNTLKWLMNAKRIIKYFNSQWLYKEFDVGEIHIFLRAKVKRSSLKLGHCMKFTPKNCDHHA